MSSQTMHPEVDLGGQVAIVTGGGRGIGRAMALALARAGAAVAVVARSADQRAQTVSLIERAGGRAIAVTTDVTDQQATEGMAREVEEQLGPADLLVNNAGAPGPCGPLWETDPDEWWRCLEVNLRGPFLCSRAVLPGMVARRRGRIITTASGAGLGPGPYVSAYVIGKCAVIRFSENLAAETKEHGISVFSITPGLVRTSMTEAGARSSEDEKWLGGGPQIVGCRARCAASARSEPGRPVGLGTGGCSLRVLHRCARRCGRHGAACRRNPEG